MLFDDIQPHPFLLFVILFIHDDAPPNPCWNYYIFIASLHFFISGYNIGPNLEHAALFISAHNDSSFLDINK